MLQIEMIRSMCALQLEIQGPLIGYLELLLFLGFCSVERLIPKDPDWSS